MSIGIRYTARSDVGMLREGNEDSAYAGAHLLAVADGMGGHVGGEIASAAAIGELRKLDADLPAGELLAALEHTVKSANDKLHRIVESDPALQGMGTTLTAMLWSGNQVALVHIGDSRAYLLRDGSLFQITHDHTLVQSLVDEGRISPDEAATHPQRSLLLRALDGRQEVDPDLSLREAKVGDRYLLCSDGLSGVITAETIFQVLTEYGDSEQAVRQLIDLANRGGGPDNITCVLADVVDLNQSGPGATTTAPMSVGAAANSQRAELGPDGGTGGSPVQHADTPAGRAAQLRETRPQPPVAVDEMPPPAPAPMHQQNAQSPMAVRAPDAPPARARGGRKWTWLVVAVALFVIALGAVAVFAVKSMRGDGFYARAEGGRVVVYQGSPESVLGVDMFAKAKQQPKPDIETKNLPEDLQKRLAKNPFVELSGADGWKNLANQLCKFSVVEREQKVVVVQGAGQTGCREKQVLNTQLLVRDLPDSDRAAVQGGKFVAPSLEQLNDRVEDLKAHREACRRDNPSITDCPGAGNDKGPR